jgi:Icc-related predicted phosphoesterase
MNDYKRVRNSKKGYRHLSPADTRLIHMNSLMEMERFLGSHDPRRTIVVTHHAPSAMSLPERRRDHSLSCAYASHLDPFILKHTPYLWIHGHIHQSRDYRIGSTRIISNPQGYPQEPNEFFDPGMIVEI